MRIYTYYEDIKHPNQDKLVNLWKLSWQQAGFDPIVLSIDDAKSSNFYEEFIEKIKYIHFKVMNKEISDYGLSCYTRWLAYATQDREYFYVSDYDCINNGLEPTITTDKLHLMDADCPCFSSGKPDQFENLCYLFVKLSLERIEDIILENTKRRNVCYHDQEFCTLNLMHQNNPKATEILELNDIIITRDRVNGVGPFEIGKQNTLKVLHISHYNAHNIKTALKDFDKMSVDDVRLVLMEKIINEQKQ